MVQQVRVLVDKMKTDAVRLWYRKHMHTPSDSFCQMQKYPK